MISYRLAILAASAMLATGAPQQSRDITVTPISGPLGLADITVRSSDPSLQPLSVQVFAPEGQRLSAPLHPSESGLWTTRIMASPDGGGTGSARIAITFKTQDALIDGPIHEITTNPAHPTPDWAKGAVWYQVFPDRFANGDTGNDPVGPEIFAAPWSAPWHPITPAELETHWSAAESLGAPARPPHHWGGRIFRRRYGGDLQGLVERLEHLRSLGVTAIYICPVFQSGSLHRYDADDHRHVDSALGPSPLPLAAQHLSLESADPSTWHWSPADRYLLDVALPAAHSRGMRVILDGVWNHVGRGHWAFLDALQHGRSSSYADWFDLRFDAAGNVVGWGAWDRPNGNLPEFRRGPDGNLVEPVRRHIADITRRWMDPDCDGDPSDGIDGWRLDVAAEVPHEFWREWHALVRSINPDALTVAEIWFPAHAWLEGDQFDAQMNYPFGMTAAAWLNGAIGSTAVSASARLSEIFSIRPEVALVQMNLITSHDTERLATFLFNRGREFNPRSRPGVDGYQEGPIDGATAERVELAFALMAMAPGAPMIYNGDEFAMWGAGDPHNRRPIPWPDLAAPAVDNPLRPDMPQRIARWFRLRTDPRIGPTLRYGATRIRESGKSQVLIFERQLNETRLVVVLNASDEPFDARDFAPDAQSSVPARSACWFDLTSE